MKVSDPIIFGHGVRAYFRDVFDAVRRPSRRTRTTGSAAILADADDGGEGGRSSGRYADGPALAMVDSDRGITNLHVPSDVIIDASMPAMIRTSGQMWNAAGEQQDTKAVIPDSSYAALYAETIDFCREHGAFDPATMGTTPNVGLMAQKAEEYGSHDKTFEIEPARQGPRGRLRGHDAARARRRGRRHLARVPDQGRADRRLGPARGRARPRDRRPRRVLARRDPRARRAGAGEGPPLPARARHRRPADRDPAGGRGDPLHARARGPRRGHDRGHRQRAARLPDRPVPDPRARHQREDALDRAADERRRAVRDRRRRVGAQARPAARQGEPPALGLARRVPRAGGLAREGGRDGAGEGARRGRPARCWRTAGRRRARSASSTTAAATSTWRSTGRRRWAGISPSGWPPTRSRSSPSWAPCRASRSTSAATTSSTATRPRR